MDTTSGSVVLRSGSSTVLSPSQHLHDENQPGGLLSFCSSTYVLDCNLIGDIVTGSNLAEWVKVRGFIEWLVGRVIDGLVGAWPPKMVDDDVYHEVHATSVYRSRQRAQVAVRAECRVEDIEIVLRIAMIWISGSGTSRYLLSDG